MATVEEKKVLPRYQMVDGFRLVAAFCPDAFREAVKFKPKAEDIILATYPKCGTTWTHMILHLLRHQATPPKSGMDFTSSCPFLEFTGTDMLEPMPSPRMMKCHLPYHLLPKSPDAKYIFVVRNPKDTLVSFYHHSRNPLYGFEEGKFDDYFELFLAGEVDYMDYFDHVLSYYEHRNDPNVLFVYYESMKKDIKSTLKKIAAFLGPDYETLISDETKMNEVVHYTSFDYMKSAVNDNMQDMMKNMLTSSDQSKMPKSFKYISNFMKEKGTRPTDVQGVRLVRKGIVGDWRVNFTPDQNKRMDEKIKERLSGTELLEYWNSIGCLQ